MLDPKVVAALQPWAGISQRLRRVSRFKLNQGAKASLVSISRRERYTSIPNGHPQETLTPVYRNLHSIDVGGFPHVVGSLA